MIVKNKGVVGASFWGKFFTFFVILALLSGFAVAWESFFKLFEGYKPDMAVFWWAALVLTALCLYGITASWKIAFGHSLFFAAGVGAPASIIVMMTHGPALAVLPVIATLLCLGGAYPFINHIVPPDPHALDDLAAWSKHLKGFPDFYRDELQGWMHAQEKRRQKAVQRQWSGLCLAIPAAALATAAADYFLIPDPGMGEDGDLHFMILLAVWGVATALASYPACAPAWALKDEMKERLLEKLTAYFKGLRYHKGTREGIDPEKFRKAGLIKRYNQESADDGFTGMHGHIGFSLAEVDLSHETGSGKNRQVEQIFDGLMIALDFPLPFKGHTLVLKDRGKLGNWLNDKPAALERVNLGIAQFEDKFEVYSTDQIEARVILTPDVMENLIRLGVLFSGYKYDRLSEKDALAAAKGAVSLAFMNKTLMITIATGKNLFEIGALDADMGDTARIAQFAREVGLIYEIIDLLELNRKAGTFSAVRDGV